MKAKILLGLGAGLVGLVGLGAVLASCARAETGLQGRAKAEFADRCTSLKGRQLGGATIEKAKFVTRNSMLLPVPLLNSPEFCRVTARIAPVQGSQITVELWLPSRWNQKLVGLGGAGFEGALSITNILMRRPVSDGYAAVATDAGHDVDKLPKWALGHPEKIVDFGYRANHLGAVIGKAVVAEFYGAPAKRAYFWGCSNGGRDALMLAQRYPQDFDAIAVGAPANNFTARMAAFSQTRLDFNGDAGKGLSSKLELLNAAAIATCDGLDGVTDGLIERPDACQFDPAQLQCKSGDSKSCLTRAEVALARSVYRGTIGRDGKQIMSGFPVGSELGWKPPKPDQNMGTSFYRYMVFNNADWSPDTFMLDRDLATARKKLSHVVDATDPDLSPFLGRGGKLLMYHGWDDPAIPLGDTLAYYEAVRKTVGAQNAKNAQLFLLPGVEHCGQGKGPDEFDFFAQLDRWTQSGSAPERFTVTKHDNRVAFYAQLPTKALRTRPACAWPKAAHYKGAGSIDDANNFECR